MLNSEIDSAFYNLHKFGVSPNAFDHCPIFGLVFSETLYPVSMKISLKTLSIGQLDFASTFFSI